MWVVVGGGWKAVCLDVERWWDMLRRYREGAACEMRGAGGWRCGRYGCRKVVDWTYLVVHLNQ